MINRKFLRTWLAVLFAAGLVGLVVWNYLGPQRTQRDTQLTVVRPGVADVSSFERSVGRVSDAVLEQLYASGWRDVDFGSIVGAVESGLPVLAGFGFDEYFADLEQRGLDGSAEGIAGRYEHKISTPRWRQLVEEGLVPAEQSQVLSLDEKARVLVETNHLFYDSRLVWIDPDSVRVKQGNELKLNAGERYTLATAISNDWPSPSESGLTIEFSGKLSTGQAVRVSLLMASSSVRGREVWGIAACAIIGTGRDKLMFAPF